MCLVLSSKFNRKKQLQQLFGKRKFIWVYKKLDQALDNEYITYYRKERIVLTPQGYFVSNRYTTSLTAGEIETTQINLGIHVYTIKRSHFFRCKGYKKDFVACNYDYEEATFTKIQFTKQNIEKFTRYGISPNSRSK